MNQSKTRKSLMVLLIVLLAILGGVGFAVAALATFFSVLMQSVVNETLSYMQALFLIKLLSFIFITLIFLKANKAIKNFYRDDLYPIFIATSERKTRDIIDVLCTVGAGLLLLTGYSASLRVVPLSFKLPAIVLLGSYFIVGDLKMSLLTQVWHKFIKRCRWRQPCD